MANQRKISYEINYQINQTNLNAVKKSMSDIQKLLFSDVEKINPKLSKEGARQLLRDTQQMANSVRDALEKAYSPKLDTFNNSTFRQEMEKNKLSLEQVYKQFSKLGATGEKAFLDIAGAITTTTTPIKESSKLLNEMATTLTNTLKWNLASSAINRLTGSVQEAYGYVKSLDRSLNNIQVVTDKSAESMDRFAIRANKTAKALGTATTDYTNAALTYYQQGLSDTEVAARAETTLKVANVSGLDAATAAEYVTSVTNGYKVAAEEVETAMDKISAVAASTASDLAELSEGMSKVASTANALGVTEDQLAATLSTVISVTRQDASSVGTAFKTIYARISDIEAGAEDAEISLGDYTAKMEELGFRVLDSSNHLRDLGTVMEEIGGSWQNLSREQQISLAQTMAGTRQYNNLIALFDNWDEYTKAVNVSLEANGTLQKQQDIYMESTAAHLEQLNANLENLYDSLLDSDTINSFTDIMNGVVSSVTALVDGLGGGGNTLLTLGSIATTVFRKQIAGGISSTIKNFQIATKTVEDYKAQLKNVDDLKDIGDEGLTRLAQMHKTYAQYRDFMSEEEQETYQTQIQEQVALEKKVKGWKKAKESAAEYLKALNRSPDNPTGEGQEDKFDGYVITSVEGGIKEKGKAGDVSELDPEALQSNISAIEEIVKTTERFQKAQAEVAASLEDITEKKKIYNTVQNRTNKEDKKYTQDLERQDELLEEASADYENIIVMIDEMESAYKTLSVFTNMDSASKELLGLTEEDVQQLDSLKEIFGENGDFKNIITKIRESENTVDLFNDKELSNDIKKLLQIEEIIKKIDLKSDDARKTLERVLGQKNGDEDDPERGAVDNFNHQQKNAKEEIGTATKVQAFAEVTSAAMSFVSALQTAVNLWEIWNNPDLSAGEKISQIIGGLIPTVISLTTTVWGLKTAADAANVSFAPLLAVSISLAALAGGITLISTLIETQEEKMQNAAKTVEDLTSKYDELTSAAEEFKASVSEYDDAINALDALEQGTQEYNEALEAANEKAKELIKTYKLWDAYEWKNGVLTIDEGVLQERINQQEQQSKALGQSLELAEQGAAQEALKYQIEKLAGFGPTSGALALNMQNVIDKAVLGIQEGVYLNSEEAIERTINAIEEQFGNEELAKTLREHASSLQALTNSSLEAANANKFFADQMIESAIGEKHREQIREMSTTVDESTEEEVVNEALVDSFTQAATEFSKKNNEETAKSLENVVGLVTEQTQNTFNGWNDDVDFNNWMNQAQKDGESINDWLEKTGKKAVKVEGDEGIARLYAQKILGMSEAEAASLQYHAGVGQSSLTYTTGYTDSEGIYHAAGSYAMQDMSEREQINAISRSYLTDYLKDKYANDTSADTQKFLAQLDVLNKNASDKYGDVGSVVLNALANGNIADLDLSSILSELSEEDVEKLKGLEGDALLKEFGWDKVDFDAFGKNSGQQFANAFQMGLNNWDASAWRDTLIQASEDAVKQSGTLLEGVESGEITAENIKQQEAFKELQSDLDKLVKTYPNLIDEQDILNNTWLVGTEAYADNLKAIQEAMSDLEIEQKAEESIEEISELFHDYGIGTDFAINIEVDTEAFDAEMEDILEREYSIDVAIHTAAESAFDEISDDMSKISEYATSIGEDFIVAATDIRELNNVFPGILEGMTVLADGSVQLNQKMVESAISAAESEVKADAQATIDKLANQATVLRAKQKIYQDMADAALVLAEGEVATEDASANARATISGGLAALENYNSNATAEQVEEDNKETVNSSLISSQSVAKNWEAAYQAVNDAAYQAAKNQVDYMQSASLGEEVKKQTVKAQTDYGYTDTGVTENDTMTETKSALTSEENNVTETWNKLAQEFQALADSSGSSATDIEGMIAEIGTSAGSINSLFDDISSGKGSSGSTSDQDLLKNKIDLYREINNEIQELTRNLEDLTSQQEKLTGPALVDNLNKQLEVLEKQSQAYEKKLKIAEKEAATEAAKLRGYGVTFDESGQMTNYEALYSQIQESVNAQIIAYNQGQKTEEQQQLIENGKKQLEELSVIALNYDKIINNTLPEISDSLEEISEKEYEIKIEKIEVAIQEATEKTDWSKIYDEFLNTNEYDKDNIVGRATLAAQSNQTRKLIRDQMQEEYKGALAAVNALDTIDAGGVDEVYGTDRAKALADAKEYGKSLMSNIQDLYSTLESLNESVLSGIDEVDRAYSDLNKTYDNINKTYQSGMKLMELLYGEDNYSGLNNYYQKQQEVYNKQLANLREEKEYWKELIFTVEEGTDEWIKYKDNFITASDELNSTLESSIQNIINTYTNAINEIFNALENKITNGLGLEYINDEWTLIKDNSEQYLDTINAAYNIQATKFKYLEAINEAEDAKIQNQINDLMEEQIKKLEMKDKLTKYDVERAEKLLNVELKRIALQEAQQNKSKMRLRRNENGDYSYQFVADEDEITKAKQELIDAENDLYNFDLEEYNESLDRAYSLYSEYQEKVLAVYTNTSLSEEERDRQLYLLNEQYNEALAQAAERNTTAKVNLENSANESIKIYYADNQAAFENMIDEEGNLIMNKLVPGWQSGVQSMIDELVRDGGLNNVMQQTLADAKLAVSDLSEKEKEAANIAGQDLKDIQDASSEVADILYNNVTDAANRVLSQSQDNLETVKDIRNEYQGWADDIEDSLIPSYRKLVSEINTAILRAQELANQSDIKYSVDTSKITVPSTSGGGSGGGSSFTSHSSKEGSSLSPIVAETPFEARVYDPIKHTSQKIREKSEFRIDDKIKIRKGGNSSDVSFITSMGQKLKVIDIVPSYKRPIQVEAMDHSGRTGWIMNGIGATLLKYDTGGYTGSWGSDGRLAMLHQKELVLNAKDTKNMLSAISILRTITTNLGDSIFNKLENITMGVNRSINGLNSGTLEQNVHIEASFPNVTKSTEIEDAFNNLTNIASQRILRDKK